jgi:thiol-disulfide isomerase/thioredoxin
MTDANNIIKDTIVAMGGQFTYKVYLNEPAAFAILPNKSFVKRIEGNTYMPPGRFIELFVSPKDKLTITGQLKPYYLNYLVKGSYLNAAYSIKRTKYELPDIEIAKLELQIDSLSAFPDKKEEIQRLFDRRRKKQSEVTAIKLNYIKNNLDNDISAYYLSRLSLDTFAKYYPKLTNGVRNGYFKNLMNKKYNTYINYTAAKKAETELIPESLAPDFKLHDLNGKDFSLSSFKGQIIVLDFWGTWCGPCLAEIPRLKSFHDSMKSKVKLIGIDCKDKREEFVKVVKAHEINWLQLINTEDNDISLLYGVMAYPTKIIIDKDLKIVKRFVGVDEGFYSLIEELTK